MDTASPRDNDELETPGDLKRKKSFTSPILCRLRSQLHAMPALDLVLQYLIDQLVLLDDGQALEFATFDVEGVHGAATTADILNLRRKSKKKVLAHFLFAIHFPQPPGDKCDGTGKFSYLQAHRIQFILDLIEDMQLAFGQEIRRLGRSGGGHVAASCSGALLQGHSRR